MSELIVAARRRAANALAPKPVCTCVGHRHVQMGGQCGWNADVLRCLCRVVPKSEETNALAANAQPVPVPNTKPAIWPLVVADMESRNAMGVKKYGTPLQPHNGRDALTDAYQEALDLCAYLRQAIFERDGK